MASNIWVKVVGFSDVERHSLNTRFRLSSVRETAYALWSPEVGAPPQVALIDVDSDVDEAETGGEAGTKISQRYYDLVIMGLDLPDADPWALVQTLHDLPTPIRSVVVATAAPSWSTMERAERLGCTGLLEIPFNPRQLIALLEKV